MISNYTIYMKKLIIILFCILIFTLSACQQAQPQKKVDIEEDKPHAVEECSTCHEATTLSVIKEKHPIILQEEYRGGHRYLCRDCHTVQDCSKCHKLPEGIPLKE